MPAFPGLEFLVSIILADPLTLASYQPGPDNKGKLKIWAIFKDLKRYPTGWSSGGSMGKWGVVEKAVS